jgi:Uma2 family endonuclease
VQPEARSMYTRAIRGIGMSAVMNEWIRRHRITVDEYYRMAETGILAPDARVELIEGVIIDMAPVGIAHAWIVLELTQRLTKAADDLALVYPQSPLRLSETSEPQPDFSLLRPPAESYRKRLPAAGDALLIIEVSDSTLRYDIDVKAPLYASHGVPEYWIVDLKGRRLRFFRAPTMGQYTEVTETPNPGLLSPAALPEVQIDLAGLMDE